MLQMEVVMCGTSHLKLHFELCLTPNWLDMDDIGWEEV